MSLWELAREKRAENKRDAEEAGGLLRAAHEEKRGLTPEEQEKFERIHSAIDERQKEIDRLERQLEVDGRLSASTGVAAGRSDTAPDDSDIKPQKRDTSKPESFLAKFARWHALKPEQRRQMTRELEAAGEERALSALSDTAGAYTVEPEAAQGILEAQLAWGGMRRAPTSKLSTSTGNDIPMVMDNDTSNEGEIVEENTAVTEGDVSFTRATLKAYTFSSKLVLVPFELLQDTFIDIETYLRDRFAKRIGRATNRKFTVGTGAKEPTGIVPSATVGKTTASATVVTWQELLALKHSVNPDYRSMPSVRWMFNDTTLLALKSIVDSTGRPIWQPSVIVGEPATIDGDRYEINQHMADIAASAKPVLYGALEYYHIRDVIGVSVVRLVERYAEKRQIGFLAFERHDGLLTDPGTGPVKSLAMHA